jgi:hypothetical protein
MTDEGLPADRLSRILTAVETIEESLGVLARKQQIGREDYKTDSDTRQLPTAEAVGLSVDSRSADTGVSDATSVAFTVIIPDFRAY